MHLLSLCCERCQRLLRQQPGRRGSFCLSGHDKRVCIGESSAMETFLKYLSMVSRERLGSLQEPAELYG